MGLIPASTLPVDPLGLSYDDDDPQTIDPRDQMNPGLVRITNGEDIFTKVSELTEDQQMAIYNNMMLDPRWSKFMLQSGFKRSATPLYWQVGQLHQDYFPGASINVPHLNSANVPTDTQSEHLVTTANGPQISTWQESDPRGFFQVGHRGKMGWIPTDALAQFAIPGVGKGEQPVQNAMPTVNCITCVFPKMYKTLYYYRMFITETVYLAGLKNTGINDTIDGVPNRELRGLDNFIFVQNPSPALPSSGASLTMYPPNPPNDGGGQL